MNSVIHKCHVCGGPARPLLDVTNVPPLQNRYYRAKRDAVEASVMNASFCFCPNCMHISIHKTARAHFDSSYNNRHLKSSAVAELYQHVANDIKRHLSSLDARILEIGCGRGELLNLLSEAGFTSVQGYDPAAPFATSNIRPTYWTPSSETAELDLVILRHTLEEIDDPSSLLSSLRKAIKPSGLLYCEITNVAHLLERELYFSLFPECANLYSPLSLAKIYGVTGYMVTDITPIKGGEWLGVWAKPLDIHERKPATILNRVGDALRQLAAPVFLWGAGGRAGDLLSFLAITTDLVKYVVDIDEAKHGLFIPPYGQRIISPAECTQLQPKSIVVMNASYLNEVVGLAPLGTNVISIDDLINKGN